VGGPIVEEPKLHRKTLFKCLENSSIVLEIALFESVIFPVLLILKHFSNLQDILQIFPKSIFK
jgi:hypothetical protein